MSLDEYRKMILSNPTLLASFEMKFVDPQMLVDDDDDDALHNTGKLSKSSAAILVPHRNDLNKSRESRADVATSVSPGKK